MNRTILVVDDCAAERAVLSGFLKEKYDMIEAGGIDEAVSLMSGRPEQVSAVIMDIAGLDGYDALQTIRANALFEGVPVIVTTSLEDESAHERAIACGANGFVVKPYSHALLLHTVENAIKLRETAAMLSTASSDKLTGLLNRETFFREAEQLISRHEPGYYILSCCDVDNFKLINDQYGTDRGDMVLRHIGNCIGASTDAAGGLCCRFTADRFAVLYPAQHADSKKIDDIHERAMTPPCIDHRIHMRIGRYLVTDLSLPVSAMFDRATLAQESIKGRYDISIADYCDSMRDGLLREQRIVGDMAGALAAGEFEPWFQPQYNHATGALIGAEALVRWSRNGRVIPPGEFIPIFEKNGFIYEVDKYIWKQVCISLQRRLDAKKPVLPISVNISRYDVLQKDFLAVLSGLLHEYGLPAELLRLEITESAFSESASGIITTVNELIARGFTVEIDDFGSGYSSLNTLKDVPASILKLDMKFFENTRDQQRGGNIIESVVRMAKWLDMAVIAEGVEDKEQADYLKSIGCYYIQGFYYAKPMPAKKYEQLLDGGALEPELTRLKTLNALDNNEFWNPRSMETLIFNSYVGGACIFEYANGSSELLRMSEQYTHELGGLIRGTVELKDSSIVRFLDGEGRKALRATMQSAIEQQKEASCEVRLTDGEQTEYMRVTVRLIARAGDRYLFYGVIVNTTAQREAQRRQAESARQLEVIMSNINGGVSAIQIHENGTSTFVFSNDKYYELYGYTREQATGINLDVMTLILKEDLPGLMEKVKKLKADRQPVIIDYRCKKQNGELAYLRANSSLMHMEGYGDVITSVVTDITEQRELSDKFSAVIENINGGVSAVYLKGDRPEFVIVNEQYYSMTGYTKEQFDAEVKNIFDLVHPQDRERVEAQFREAIRRGGRYTMEYRFLRRDGAVRNVLCTTNVISLFGVAEPVQLAVSNDITELREAQKKELESAGKLNAVLNHAASGITAIALHGEEPEFLFVNDRYFEIIGYAREEYARATAGDMFAPVHPDDREELRKKVTGLNRSFGSLSTEYRVLRPSGALAWIKAEVTVTNVAGIDVPVQIGMFSDITAQREANDQLRFINDSAHDILAQPDSDRAICDTLKKLTAYFAAGRGYIVELDPVGHTSSNTYEVCAAGMPSEKANLQNVPFSGNELWYSSLERNEYFVIEDVNALSGEGGLKKMLLSQGIRSIALAPLSRDGRLVGFVGMDNPRRALNQLSRLTALTDHIAVLLTRRDLERRIERDGRAMQMLINDTPGGFLRMEILKDGQPPAVTGMNEGLCRMLHMTRDEVTAAIGSDTYGCVEQEDMPAISARAREALSSGGQFTGKCRIRRGDGELMWASVSGRFSCDDGGRLFLNSYFTDITEEKRAEDQQKRLLDNLPCGAVLYEFDGQRISVVHVNRRYKEMVGRDTSPSDGAGVLNVFHPDDLPKIKKLIYGAGGGELPVDSLDIRIRHADGSYHTYRINSRVIGRDGDKRSGCATFLPIPEDQLTMQQLMPYIFPAMMEASTDITFAKDKEFRYLCCSHAYAKLLGLEDESCMVGKTDHELFSADIADQFREDDIKLTSGGGPIIDKQEILRTGSGLPSYIRISKYLLRDAVGNVQGIYGIGRDITERRETSDQLKLITNSIPGGLATFACTDTDYRMEYFNDGFCRLFGYAREEFDLSVPQVMDTIFAEDRAMVDDRIAALVRDDTPVDIVYRVHTRDGGYKWVNHKAIAVDRVKDAVIVNAVFLDVTEQQEEKEKLRVSEELNRLAIEHSGNIITRFDVRARTLTLPDSFNPIFVLPHVLNNMPGEQIALGRVSPDTADIYTELFESIVRGQAVGTATYKQNSTKGWRWLEAQYTTVFSSTGEPVSAVISFADITEELEKEVVYNKWQQSLYEREEASYTLLRCNLSKGDPFDSREGGLIDMDPDDIKLPFSTLTAKYAEAWVHPEDRGEYIAFLDPGTLLAEYYRDRRSFSLEYREQTGAASLRWLRLTVELVEYPSSRDIEAYLMYEDIDEQKRAELLTLERAERDPLTGILNRTAFIAQMERVLEASKPGERHALMMLDIDDFKHVNDTLGHAAGDGILRNIAGSMGAMLRRDDILGRMGGDEFFVFLKNIPGRDAAVVKARQICELRLHAEGSDTPVTASIGVAMAPDDGRDFGSLYEAADRALYRQKAHGKNGFMFAEK